MYAKTFVNGELHLTKQELAGIFGLSTYFITLKQWQYGVADPDYLSRVYIYNSGNFQLKDSVDFVISQSGVKEIRVLD